VAAAPVEQGAYSAVTAKAALVVLQALLWRFHNCQTGKCSPSYEANAEAAACSRTDRRPYFIGFLRPQFCPRSGASC
jgi:hypothetical protein